MKLLIPYIYSKENGEVGFNNAMVNTKEKKITEELINSTKQTLIKDKNYKDVTVLNIIKLDG